MEYVPAGMIIFSWESFATNSFADGVQNHHLGDEIYGVIKFNVTGYYSK